MRLLLDTHTLLWWLSDSKELCAEARNVIRDGANSVHVSAVSAWEIAIKRSLGKLEAPENLSEVIEASRFRPLAVSFAHAEALNGLPPHHRDPFDRMLVAQAMVEGLTLVTKDRRLSEYRISLIQA